MTLPLRRSLLLIAAAVGVAVAAFVALRPDATTTHAGPVTIAIGDQWFCDESFEGGLCETNVQAGTTVVWDATGASLPHTTTECGASCDGQLDSSLWDSGFITSDGSFEFTFDAPGSYIYRCEVHPNNMRGRIVVAGAPATATSTPVGDTPPPPTATSTATTPAGVTGDANGDDVVNAIDASLVLQFVAGFFSNLPSTADANVDGVTNAIDSAVILQFVAGLISQLPP